MKICEVSIMRIVKINKCFLIRQNTKQSLLPSRFMKEKTLQNEKLTFYVRVSEAVRGCCFLGNDLATIHM